MDRDTDGRRPLVTRGGPATTRLAHEFGLHEHPWPRLLGTDRWKWERLVAFVDKAAQQTHKRECGGPMADGLTRIRSENFAGPHAESHRQLTLVDMLAAGIPKWLTEPSEVRSET